MRLVYFGAEARAHIFGLLFYREAQSVSRTASVRSSTLTVYLGAALPSLVGNCVSSSRVQP